MTRGSLLSTLLVAAGVLAPSNATRADEVPSWFVPQDQCTSKPCTCEDIPAIETFLNNQKDALAAWKSVQSDIATPAGPSTPAEAIALFGTRFTGDPSVVTQFKSCPNYDPSKNDPNKVAGVTGLGEAALDPCFCSAFCADIVGSTVVHEMMHVPTIIAGVVNKGDLLIGCELGVVEGRVCDAIMPSTLADSEVASYGAGVSLLEASLQRLRASDPEMPEMACTWMPLAPTKKASLPSEDGFFERLALLVRRILWGAPPALAAVDVTPHE